jgi:hypothetical protein
MNNCGGQEREKERERERLGEVNGGYEERNK